MGEAQSIEQMEKIRITRRGGGPIYLSKITLSDVATVENGLNDAQRINRVKKIYHSDNFLCAVVVVVMVVVVVVVAADTTATATTVVVVGLLDHRTSASIQLEGLQGVV